MQKLNFHNFEGFLLLLPYILSQHTGTGELFFLPTGEVYRDMETMMASKKAAVFAAKFEKNLPRNGKSFDNNEHKLYEPEFTNAEEKLQKYNNNRQDGDVLGLSAFNLGVNAE